MSNRQFRDVLNLHIISEVSCNGSEAQLQDCSYALPGTSCGGLDDAAVACQRKSCSLVVNGPTLSCLLC